MSYTITDRFHQLVIKMTTDIYDSANLYLDVYKQGSFNPVYSLKSSAQKELSDGRYEYTFIIHNSDNRHNIGDVLDKFVMEYRPPVSSQTPVKIWNTSEGVDVQLDGERYKTIRSDHFKLTFNEPKEESLQVIYAGNKQTKMAYTPLERFVVSQVPKKSSSKQQLTGRYILRFYDKKELKDLTFHDGKRIHFVLTRGGDPIAGKTVEVMLPNGDDYSTLTDRNGIVSWKNNRFNAGKYTIGAFFVQDGRVQDRAYADITIKKAKVEITHQVLDINDTKTKVKKRVTIRVTDKNKKPFKKTKISVYDNNNLKTIKTNDMGLLSIDLKKGTHKFRVVYNGSKNYEQTTETFTVKVS